jgi:hypothetical protein
MILLLGFNKSGTTSFQDLFIQLGYESHHFFWNENRQNNILISDMMKHQKNVGQPLLGFVSPDKYENVCLTQMDACFSNDTNYWPQVVDYERLYEENPNAIFILNKRNPEKLLHSFQNWRPNYLPLQGLSLMERIFRYNPDFFHPYSDLKTQEEQFLQFVQTHYQKVEDFFESRPEAKFVSYNIETDRIDKLKPYIDLKNITELPFIKPT